MKRSVIISTAILLVVTALCLTAVTFSFFTTKSSNIQIDIDSMTTEAFSFEFKPENKNSLKNSKSTTLGEIKVVKDYLYCTIDYETQKDYSNMYFTVAKFALKDKPGEIGKLIERTNLGKEGNSSLNESDYLASMIQYQFVEVPKQTTPETHAPLAGDQIAPDDNKWKLERPFVGDDDLTHKNVRDEEFFNLGAINGTKGQVKGQIRFYLKIDNFIETTVREDGVHKYKPQGPIDSELIPGNIDGYTLQVTIQAKQLP